LSAARKGLPRRLETVCRRFSSIAEYPGSLFSENSVAKSAFISVFTHSGKIYRSCVKTRGGGVCGHSQYVVNSSVSRLTQLACLLPPASLENTRLRLPTKANPRRGRETNHRSVKLPVRPLAGLSPPNTGVLDKRSLCPYPCHQPGGRVHALTADVGIH
jgi:hypothetical protein